MKEDKRRRAVKTALLCSNNIKNNYCSLTKQSLQKTSLPGIGLKGT